MILVHLTGLSAKAVYQYLNRNHPNQGGPDAFGYRFVDNVSPDTATQKMMLLK